MSVMNEVYYQYDKRKPLNELNWERKAWHQQEEDINSAVKTNLCN